MVLFFLVPHYAAPAQDTSVALERDKSGLLATVAFALSLSPQRLEPIDAGLKSRMLFTLQVMERREGVFSFLGDITVGELTVDYSGYRDFLEDVYILEDAQGVKHTFQRAADFFRAFTRLDRLPLDAVLPRGPYRRYYLRVRVRYFPVKLVAPLTLIYVLSTRDVIESDWHVKPLPDRRVGE